jgi:CubicO group peptidase (beta-lactamase class C family)
MTATLVGVFVEQSLMTWDMTPLDVWPEMAAGIRNEYRTATVEQLLSHQAGLPTDVTAIPSFQRVTDIAPGSVVEKRLLWATELLQLAPEIAAGNFLYTNAGYIIAGAMMETLSGSSWESLIADQLFGPLAMNETGFGAPGTEGQVDEPWGHRFLNGGLTPIPPGPAADNPAAIGPAGTVHASLEDLARYMQSHINGERGIPGPVTAATFQFLHSPSGGWPYGMGWNVDDSDEGTMGPTLQHGGSNDRWFARIALAPGLDIGLLIVTNAGGAQADEAIDELGDLMIERIRASF